MTRHEKTNTNAVQPMKSSQGQTINVRLEKLGVSRFDINDPYHLALTLTWPQFFSGLVVVYLAINLGFALLYYLAPGSVANLPPHSLTDAFFFSIETLATVGYGAMSPASLFGHIVSSVETFVGMVLTATMTGLVFVRFSKPKAKLIFADNAVVTQHHGQPTLMIRMGNGRLTALSDAVARLTALVQETTPEGQRLRRSVDLKLLRNDIPYFPLTWTLMHPLTEDSALYRALVTHTENLGDSDALLMLSVTARDPALGAQVYDACSFRVARIALGMRYADALTTYSPNHSVADMRKISDIEPDVTPTAG